MYMLWVKSIKHIRIHKVFCGETEVCSSVSGIPLLH